MDCSALSMHAPILAALSEADITIDSQILTSSNGVFVGTLTNTPYRCIYKPISYERPLWDFSSGTLAQREVAVYLISQELGWSIVPPIVLRQGPLGQGSVQYLIENPTPHAQEPITICTKEKLPEKYLLSFGYGKIDNEIYYIAHNSHIRLYQLMLLDLIINNADRKAGHVITDAQGIIYGIDHGICLHEEHKLRSVIWGWATNPIAEEFIEQIATFLQKIPTIAQLTHYLNEHEITALKNRCEKLILSPIAPSLQRPQDLPWPLY